MKLMYVRMHQTIVLVLALREAAVLEAARLSVKASHAVMQRAGRRSIKGRGLQKDERRLGKIRRNKKGVGAKTEGQTLR